MSKTSKSQTRKISRRNFLQLSAAGAAAIAQRKSSFGETVSSSNPMLLQSGKLSDTHDLISLPQWGPYSKKYFGISHIPDLSQGMTFDLSLFPTLVGAPVRLPNVTERCGVYPWEASPRLDFYSLRMEMLPKEQLFCNLSFQQLGNDSRLIRIELVNNTVEQHSIAFHSLTQLCFPPFHELTAQPIRLCDVQLPSKAQWVDALDYLDMKFASPRPTDNLVTEGRWRGEERCHDAVGGSVLAQNFGRSPGDTVLYSIELPQSLSDAALLFRYQVPIGKTVAFTISGITDQQVAFTGSEEFSTTRIHLGHLPASHHTIRLTSQGGVGIALNGFALVEAPDAASVHFTARTWQQKPQLQPALNHGLLLKYSDTSRWYGYSLGLPEDKSELVPWHDMDRSFNAHSGQDTQDRIFGRGPGRPGDPDSLFVHTSWSPITLPPSSHKVLYGIVASGPEEATRTAIAAFDPHSDKNERTWLSAKAKSFQPATVPQGTEMLLSQRLLAATTMTNVVYPLRTQRKYIRHYSPGKIWDCLYTWDAGFIGLGLLEIDLDAAIAELNAYTTAAGSQSAFIHHGTPLPTQIYLFIELWNRTQSRPLLAYFYPRLRQYYLFVAGHLGSSTTRKHQDQLICTWDYFYNTGGWDDYPPQVFAHKASLTGSVAPVVSSSHIIRAAKLLRQVAKELHMESDLAGYDNDIQQLSTSLQHYSWDPSSGYFGYVLHDKAGAPTDILRTQSGVNFNMGLDGVSPLIAGICSTAQQDAILHNLFSEDHLWTAVGITTVDKQAPYYNPNGYWNGSIWFAHQWFLFKTMLDLGRGDLACQIAQTGLNTWKKSTDSSHECMEHFSPEPPYGAGWSQFSSLSSPVLSWFAALYTPGRLTTGFDCWIGEARFSSENSRLHAVLSTAGSLSAGTSDILVCMNASHSYEVRFNGAAQEFIEVHPGLLYIKLRLSGGANTSWLKCSATVTR
jgi:hypothetical protein